MKHLTIAAKNKIQHLCKAMINGNPVKLNDKGLLYIKKIYGVDITASTTPYTVYVFNIDVCGGIDIRVSENEGACRNHKFTDLDNDMLNIIVPVKA